MWLTLSAASLVRLGYAAGVSSAAKADAFHLITVVLLGWPYISVWLGFGFRVVSLVGFLTKLSVAQAVFYVNP
jgi:hypothetical protein